MTQDFIAAAEFLRADDRSTGKVGVVGFCFGGGMANRLAVCIPDVVAAAVPFYGRNRRHKTCRRSRRHCCSTTRNSIDGSMPVGLPTRKALKAAGVQYTAYMYAGVNHGFHNDTTPRYDESAAKLAWKRTIDFLNATLHR